MTLTRKGISFPETINEKQFRRQTDWLFLTETFGEVFLYTDLFLKKIKKSVFYLIFPSLKMTC
jgi:hypothetical protein